MKRSITLGELIVSAITILAAVLSFWISTSVRLSALEINQQQQNINYQESKESFKSINEKLDHITEVQSDIKISLERKQDKK